MRRRYEYLEVSGVEVAELNELGAEGWWPATMTFCGEAHWDQAIGAWVSGWCGLLYREIEEEDDR